MDAHFSIKIEPERCLIYIMMVDFSNNEDVLSFRRELAEVCIDWVAAPTIM